MVCVSIGNVEKIYVLGSLFVGNSEWKYGIRFIVSVDVDGNVRDLDHNVRDFNINVRDFDQKF